MTGKILVLTAIDDELDKARAPAGAEVVYSGVGKVNAASGATLALSVLRPSLVIRWHHNVIPGHASSRGPGISKLLHEIPGSRFRAPRNDDRVSKG
jgi:hypothetical protein